MALNGWHIGERRVRTKLEFDKIPSISTQYMYIDGDLPPEHAEFHTNCLPFIPVTALDESNRPWGSILAGRDGEIGFIDYPRYTTLRINGRVWDGDPLRENARLLEKNGTMLIAGIGIEFPTRRRNKLAGKVISVDWKGDDFLLQLVVNEAIG
jgi:hypothetical protein